MAFWERVLHYDGPGLSIHWVLALLDELARGRVTKAQIDAALGLDVAEAAELQTLINTFSGSVPARLGRAIEVHDIGLLGESRLPPYDSVAAVKTRLGV